MLLIFDGNINIRVNLAGCRIPICKTNGDEKIMMAKPK